LQSALSAVHFHNEEAAFAYVEARFWPDGPVCPHCGTIGKAARLKGKTTRPGLYKCYACRKPFTVRMRSVFESSHVPLRVWLQVIYLMCSSKKGISSRQIQRTLGCGLKTAWFLSHRIRECMKEVRDLFIEPMGGAGRTIEAGEAYIGGKAENRAYKPVPAKMFVMSLVQRGGGIRGFHVPNVTAKTLHPIIGPHAHKDSRFVTDESNIYKGVGWTSRATAPSTTPPKNTLWGMSIPTPSRDISRSSSAASTAFTITCPRLT